MCCFIILLLVNELRWYLFRLLLHYIFSKSCFSPLPGYSLLRENKTHRYPSKCCQEFEVTKVGYRRKSK